MTRWNESPTELGSDSSSSARSINHHRVVYKKKSDSCINKGIYIAYMCLTRIIPSACTQPSTSLMHDGHGYIIRINPTQPKPKPKPKPNPNRTQPKPKPKPKPT